MIEFINNSKFFPIVFSIIGFCATFFWLILVILLEGVGDGLFGMFDKKYTVKERLSIALFFFGCVLIGGFSFWYLITNLTIK